MSFRDTHLKKWGLITNTNSSKPTDKLQNYHPELLPSAPYLHWHFVVSALQQSGQVSESNTVFHQNFVLSVAVRVAVILTCCQQTTLFKTSRPCTFKHTKKVKRSTSKKKKKSKKKNRKKNQQGIKCVNAVFICSTDIYICYISLLPAAWTCLPMSSMRLCSLSNTQTKQAMASLLNCMRSWRWRVSSSSLLCSNVVRNPWAFSLNGGGGGNCFALSRWWWCTMRNKISTTGNKSIHT